MMPEQGILPPLWIVSSLLILLNGGTMFFLYYSTKGFTLWMDMHRLALFCGFISFFIVMSVVKEAEGFTGNSIIALFSIWFLFKLSRQVKVDLVE